ncbi:MATE family efflux transporter [Nioella nitratireducens]|uniref:MATE family efflux transporter n=1 Tax=Nioella nitratireducens TaxID=1287720 RepID=UPI0008FD9592|nr:MATE family efflux transporter [Nioella nitratireducens]
MAETPAAPVALTHRRVLWIALPILLSNITVPLLGAVDTAVVGQMGLAAPLGAVAVGASVLSMVYWIFGFLRMGTTGLTAQAMGAGNRAEVAALLTRVLMIGLAAGAILIALQTVIFGVAFRIAPASDEVEGLARGYMAIRIWSAPAAIAIFGINGWLIARERTASLLALQVWMNGLNILLDLIFVLRLDWGVAGVATATVCAEWSGLAFGLWLCRGAFRVPDWRDWARVFDREKLLRMASVNTDIMIRSVLLTTGFTTFMLLGSGLGDVTLASNQILMQFLQISAFALDGFALAAETLVGQAIGARSRGGLRQGAVMASWWAAGIALALSAAFALAGGRIIDLMTTAEGVRETARAFLPWAVAAPLFGAPSFMLDGVFIGATRTRDMRNMMALAFAGYVAALALFLPAFGNHGLWAALMVFFTLRAITLAVRYPALERATG